MKRNLIHTGQGRHADDLVADAILTLCALGAAALLVMCAMVAA